MFCEEHSLQHRQEIKRQFDGICEKHAFLQQDLNNTKDNSKSSELFSEIDQFEQEMMDQIKRTTKTAKERLLQMFKEKEEIKKEFNSLTKELRLKQSQSDYDETDVDHWKEELTKLTKQLRQLLTSNDNKIDWNTNSSIDLANLIQAVPLPASSPNQEQLFTGGALLHKGHQLKLNEFYGQTSQRWHLIYKAEKNGFAAKDFHRQCDGEGPTMTIIQSQEGNYLFGAFTMVPWTSQNGYKRDPNAFLFTLTNPHNLKPTKFPIIPEQSQYAVYHTNTNFWTDSFSQSSS
ncbi:unnamed protein product [Didymodactylos carnosus]|uniref:TLDc domain-containing protein n=1 Tax=Didymodactylos carnosus TaxID=1234261 RepID=A0A814N3L5_9BILA|nr:unnamed protein product [Didymodactylos carnosus]CAF3852280.1 unnamed protein product [Didymodactylos carnosus]